MTETVAKAVKVLKTKTVVLFHNYWHSGNKIVGFLTFRARYFENFALFGPFIYYRGEVAFFDQVDVK